MVRKTFLALAAAGSLIAAAAAFAPSARDPAVTARADTGYSHATPRFVNRHAHDSCLAEPVACGLVVW
jgi:hypothetical protein